MWTLWLVGIIYPVWYYYIRRRSIMLTESSLSFTVITEVSLLVGGIYTDMT